MKTFDPKISYIEVGVYDGKVESIGLLSSFDTIGNNLIIVPKDVADTAFLNLTFFTLTLVRVAYEKRIEEYFFDDSISDQKSAITVLKSITSLLKADKRCTTSGFIQVNSYNQVPIDYIHTKVSKNCVQAPTQTTLLGGTATATKTNLYGCTVHGHNANDLAAKTYSHTAHAPIVHKPYVAPSKIIYIKRTSVLPKKAELRALEKLIKSGKFGPVLPNTEDMDDDGKVETTVTTYDDSYDSMYGGY